MLKAGFRMAVGSRGARALMCGQRDSASCKRCRSCVDVNNRHETFALIAMCADKRGDLTYILDAMLAWMDLEMTGLDPKTDLIVEVATLITDDDLEIIEEGPDLVISVAEEHLQAMDPIVVAMHTRSGLLDAIRASTVSLDMAREATLAFLRRHIPDAATVPLCGNSIGTDRRFLAQWLPEIDEHLHYRSVDVSTIKELARRWYPDAARNAPRKAGGHRALDDIRESVAELRYFRNCIFLPKDANSA